MKKSKKFLALIMAFVMIATAIPMMTASADIGGWGDILGKKEDKHEHVYVIEKVEEGSCTETAKTTFKCGCGDVQVMTTGDPAHTPAVNGYSKKDEKVHSNYCTKCKKLFEEPHEEFEYVVYDECKAPTCSEEGKLVYKCYKCNAKRTEVLEKSVHVPSGKVVTSKDKHGFTCISCENLISEEHVWDEGTIDGSVKCGDDGKIIYRCKVAGCYETKEEKVPSACTYPDKEDIEYGWASKVDKFDEKGHTYDCKHCGKDKTEAHEFVVSYTYSTKVVDTKMIRMAEPVAEPVAEEPSTTEPTTAPTTEPTTAPTTESTTANPCADGHDYGKWMVTKEVTCAEDGYQVRECKTCGNQDSKNIPATGDHNYEWVMVKEPTVDNAGKEISQCTVCKKEAGERYVVVVMNTPTCKDEGEILVSCKYCNYSYTATVDTVDHKIAEDAKCTKYTKENHKTTCEYCGEVKVPHTWGDWKTTEAATTDKEGTKTRECTGCGEKETAKIDKLTAILGDVNKDGSVSAMDAQIILQHVAKLRVLTDEQQELADMDKNGTITALDAREILMIVAGLKK